MPGPGCRPTTAVAISCPHASGKETAVSMRPDRIRAMVPTHPDPGLLAIDNVRSLSPYVPGKPIEELQRELGLSDIIKLASNENPFGPSPRALDAMQRALTDTWLYPDGSGHILK